MPDACLLLQLPSGHPFSCSLRSRQDVQHRSCACFVAGIAARELGTLCTVLLQPALDSEDLAGRLASDSGQYLGLARSITGVASLCLHQMAQALQGDPGVARRFIGAFAQVGASVPWGLLAPGKECALSWNCPIQ